MKRIAIMCLLILSLVATSFLSSAQRPALTLNEIADAAVRKLQDKKPEWKHNLVTPIAGGRPDKVIIQQWTLGQKVVKISIMQYQSAQEATSILRKFAADVKADMLPNVGDEGCVWGISGSVAFRKGNLTVFITAASMDIQEEPTLSKDFAEQIAVALATP